MKRKKLNTIKACEEPTQLCGSKNIVNEIEKKSCVLWKKMYFCPKIDKSKFDFAQMNEYDEYLLLGGGGGETKHISSNDICYIEADGRYSNLYLNNGEVIYLNIKLGEFNELIDKWFPFNHKFFYRIGKSLIINRKYLAAFYVSKGVILIADNRSEYIEGYKAGYKAGYTDKEKGRSPYMTSSPHPEVKILSASEKALKEFRDKIEEKISRKNDPKK